MLLFEFVLFPRNDMGRARVSEFLKYLLEVCLSKNLKLKLYKPIVQLSFRSENTCFAREYFLCIPTNVLCSYRIENKLKISLREKKGKTFFVREIYRDACIINDPARYSCYLIT